MLDKLKDLFSGAKIQCVSAVVKAIADLAGFLDQQFQGDKDKFNEAIDHLKDILEQHKKV